MGNSVQHKRRNPTNCLGCMGQEHEGFDQYELYIGLDGDKPRGIVSINEGSISQQSTFYLKEDEIRFLNATAGRNISLVRYYLDSGVNINILDQDRTSPLQFIISSRHIACRYGSIQVVEELIKYGANLDITDMAGWTPLHVAAFYQRSQVCQILLRFGTECSKIRNREGNLPIDLVRDKMTAEVFKQEQDLIVSNSKSVIVKQDSRRVQHECFSGLALKQKSIDSSSYVDSSSFKQKRNQKEDKENFRDQSSSKSSEEIHENFQRNRVQINDFNI